VNPRPRCGRQGEATRRRGGAWWPPRGPREQVDHDQPALTAGGTQVTRAAGRAPGLGRLRHGCGSGGRGSGCVPGQAALELVPEGTMHRTPQPIGADGVEPLGQHMREKATHALLGRQGHGRPTLVVGVVVAAGDGVLCDGEEAVVGQRAPVDIPAQVLQELLGVANEWRSVWQLADLVSPMLRAASLTARWCTDSCR
jgi:hypothetical protein